jgi:glycosyltransferase involved in cell wall biosynthesis
MRALIVTNLWPTAAEPQRGSFVRDQVTALRARGDIDVEVFRFAHGGARPYLRAAPALRRRYRGERFDVVHAHFGLTAWPSLAVRGAPHAVTLHGTDVRHPRSGRITRAVLTRMDLVAAVSAELAAELPPAARRLAVLPCGVATDRFRPIARADARRALGLPEDEPCLLLPADPQRPGKRADRAREVAGDVRLLALGRVDPHDVPLYVNAANAVLVPSDAEGFGLAVLEALACDVPVLATPVGVHPAALDGIEGTLCAPYDRETWRTAARRHLDNPDPRVAGRERAQLWSAERMADRVVAAWRELSVASETAPARAHRT